MRQEQPRRRVASVQSLLIGITVIVAVAALAYWAGRTAVVPPGDSSGASPMPVVYEVVEQTIGRSLPFTAEASWQASPVGRNWAPGVITSVDFEPGAEVANGEPVFSVDLRPVAIAEGTTPAFRDLELDVQGRDVRQLQAMLAETGFLATDPDGAFGPETAEAVRAWQASLGIEGDGVVRQGDLVFMPELPVRLVPSEALVVGAPLSGGETVLERLSATPSFIVVLSPEQRDLVPLSGEVVVAYPEGRWNGVIARAVERTNQGIEQLQLVIEAADGGPVCGSVCIDWIDPIGTTNFEAEIVVVPRTTGPVVPVAAIVTNAGGAHSVRLSTGETVPIEVIASTNALAVVTGVEPGDSILLPFSERGSE